MLCKYPAWNFGWRRISYVFRGSLQRVPATSDGLKSLSEPQSPPFLTHATRNIHTSYVTCPNFQHLTLTYRTYGTRHLFTLYLSTLVQHIASTIQLVITDSEMLWKEVVMDYYITANIPEFVWRGWMEARGTYQNIRSLDRDLTFRRRIFFFLILAHPVYKMWIIQEPNTLELWKKNCILKRKIWEYTSCLKYSVHIFVE